MIDRRIHAITFTVSELQDIRTALEMALENFPREAGSLLWQSLSLLDDRLGRLIPKLKKLECTS